MAEKKTTPIVIDDVEYIYEEMTDKQQRFVRHIQDLDRKIRSTQFNLEQLSVGKDALFDMLKAELLPPEAEE